MNKFLIILTTINGFIFLILGLVWAISPYNAGANFGILVIPEGLGRSSLIGDIGSYFFCIGTMMILAAYTLKNIWFYAPAIEYFRGEFMMQPLQHNSSLSKYYL